MIIVLRKCVIHFSAAVNSYTVDMANATACFSVIQIQLFPAVWKWRGPMKPLVSCNSVKQKTITLEYILLTDAQIKWRSSTDAHRHHSKR